MTIAEAYRRAQSCVDGFWAKSDETVEEMYPQMADMQREQMYRGEKALGIPIVPPYTLYTVYIKTAKGQPTDRVTLKDTGAFYEGIYVERHGKELVFDSTDEKTSDLKEKYGESIFGLQKENYEHLSEEWTDKMTEWAKKTILNE